MAARSAPTSLAGKVSSQVWTSYTLVMTPGQAVEDALDSDFWAHVAKMLQPYDTVRLIAEDGSYVAEIMVTTAGGTYVKMTELWRWVRPDDTPQTDADAPQIAYPKFRGPVLRWCVMRTSDDDCLKEGFQDKPAAEQWLRDYVATITR
jgi:hypothetical protein